jgi:hypothetical protein
MGDNNENVKQIQFSADFFKAKKRRTSTNTRKKAALPPHMSPKTVNTIKNNLVQRIQSHKANEMGGIENVYSDATLKKMNAVKVHPTHATAQINAALVNPPTNHLTDAMHYLSNMNPEKRNLNKTMKHMPTISATNNNGGMKDPPPFSNLKGGTKPGYRDWISQTQKHRPTFTNSVGAAANATNENSVNGANAVKIIRKRKMTLGKSKHNVGVLVKNAKTRKDILQAKKEIQNTNIHDIKHDLLKKGIIRCGSVAPDDVLKHMYESSILAGHITNTSNMYKNVLDDLEDK